MLGEADKKHPPGGEGIARRKPERLVNMGLRFFGVAEKIRRETDPTMSVGQISV